MRLMYSYSSLVFDAGGGFQTPLYSNLSLFLSLFNCLHCIFTSSIALAIMAHSVDRAVQTDTSSAEQQLPSIYGPQHGLCLGEHAESVGFVWFDLHNHNMTQSKIDCPPGSPGSGCV